MVIQFKATSLWILFLFAPCSGFANFNSLSPEPDSLVADTNKLWFDKGDFLLIGLGADQRDFDINFKNNTLNRIGYLQFTHISSELGFNLSEWRFSPTINQNNASFNLTTKYGSVAYTKAIKPVGTKNYTRTSAFNFSFPVKNFTFSFEYLKFIGLNRVEPAYKTTAFLKDMEFNPIAFNIEYTLKTVYGRKGGMRLKNNLFYIPKKPLISYSIFVGLLKLTVKNPSDFIPGLMYKNNHQTDSIIQVPGVYVNKFTSTGFFMGGPKVSFLVPIIKGKNIYKPKVLYLKVIAYYGLNSQKYDFQTLVDTIKRLDGINRNSMLKGYGLTTNYHFRGSLIYDFNIFLIGITASFNKQNYGDGDAQSNDMNVSDRRVNYYTFLSFRLGAKRIYGKIDSIKSRIFN